MQNQQTQNQNNHIEFPIVLTNDECFFIAELCANELDFNLAIKINAVCLHQPEDRCTVLLSSSELTSLIYVLLRKAKQATRNVSDWAEDIAKWLMQESNRWVVVH